MNDRQIVGEHVGGCNDLCDDELGHYLAADWTTIAERQSAIAEANRWTAKARLATREALVLMREGKASS